MAYNSSHTGAQIDAAVSAVRQKESVWDAKETPSGAQQKADAAESAAKAASDPAGSASQVQQNLNSHTGNSTIHVTSSDKSNWNSKAPGSLSTTVSNLEYDLNSHTGNSGIHVTEEEKVYRLSHSKSGNIHYLTGLSGAPSGIYSCIFRAVDSYSAGDTIRVDGYTYSVMMQDGSAAPDNLFVAGNSVAVIVDKGNQYVNFKAGGEGLSDSDLSLATAAASDVLQGKTFYAGDKSLKTGTLEKGHKLVSGSFTVTSGYKQINVGFQPVYLILFGNSGYSRVLSAYSTPAGEGYAYFESGNYERDNESIDDFGKVTSTGFYLKGGGNTVQSGLEGEKMYYYAFD